MFAAFFTATAGILSRYLTALKALNYVIEVRLVNAVNYGVPQNRERVIVVGHRGEFQFFDEESKSGHGWRGAWENRCRKRRQNPNFSRRAWMNTLPNMNGLHFASARATFIPTSLPAR